MKGKSIKKGSRFGRIKILKIIPPRHFTMVKIKCNCGVIKIVGLSNVISGRIKSCGCLRREKWQLFRSPLK